MKQKRPLRGEPLVIIRSDGEKKGFFIKNVNGEKGAKFVKFINERDMIETLPEKCVRF